MAFGTLIVLFVAFQNCTPSDQTQFSGIFHSNNSEKQIETLFEKASPDFPIASEISAIEPQATLPLLFSKRPEPPALLHEVFEVDITRNPDGSILQTAPQFYRPIRPTIPPVRTTHDGRLGFNSSDERLYLLAPEKITRPFPLSEPGLNILTNSDGWQSHWTHFLEKSTDPIESGFTGGAICNHVRESEQPRKCGINDCYDVTFMGFRTIKSQSNPNGNLDRGYFRSRKIVIEVENPKTPNARIRDVRLATHDELKEKPDPIEMDYNISNSNFASFEPMVTNDGRLFVARANFVAIKKIDDAVSSGDNDVDIYFMVAPLEAEPCDASQFSYVKRIQRAPFDPDMKNPKTGKARYGIAEYPMRDSFGNFIPEDAMFPTYPWIDRAGNNLFFASGGSTLFSYDWKFNKVPTDAPERSAVEQERLPKSSRYPSRCIEGVKNCDSSPYNPESPEHVRGFAMIGSWTHGKTVVLDGMINHTDYGLKRGLQFQREINLYQSNRQYDGWVRVGAGRDSGSTGSGLDNKIESLSENAEIKGMGPNSNTLGSLENLMNTYRYLRPTLPRSLVWTINNSVGSDEIAFDDYIDNRSLIVSSMIAGVEFINAPNSRSDRWYYRDGFDGENDNIVDKQSRAILIQNAATSLTLPIPPFGYLSAGRVEPVALGGIHGRGLWLDGSNSLSYEFSTSITSSELFLSIFFDNRSTNENFRQLIGFPDGTRVFLNSTKLKIKNNEFQFEVPLTSKKSNWTHLGLAIAADGKSGAIYFNGMKKQSFTSNKPIFRIENSKDKIILTIGKQNARDPMGGFRGWIDELKLFSYIPSSEVICNHAFGSLHWLKEEATTQWLEVSDSFPLETHNEIFNELPSHFTREQNISPKARFVCTTDYKDSMGLYRSRLRHSEGLLSLRDVLFFSIPKEDSSIEDGRPLWNTKSMDYRNNQNCSACHNAEERRGLDLASLEATSFCALSDKRESHFLGPRYLSGQVTDEQLRAIDPFHEQLNKFVDPRSGSLMTRPMLLSSRAGVSCLGFTPNSTLPSLTTENTSSIIFKQEQMSPPTKR
jgi:hypothetical protein